MKDKPAQMTNVERKNSWRIFITNLSLQKPSDVPGFILWRGKDIESEYVVFFLKDQLSLNSDLHQNGLSWLHRIPHNRGRFNFQCLQASLGYVCLRFLGKRLQECYVETEPSIYSL